MEDIEEQDVAMAMSMSNANTTIDPSVIQSRILQSSSLAKQEHEHEHDTEEQQQQQQHFQQPTFPQVSAMKQSGNKVEYRRVRCPPHRYTPLRENWEQILTPLVEFLKLQVRPCTNDSDYRKKTCKACKRKKVFRYRREHGVVPRPVLRETH